MGCLNGHCSCFEDEDYPADECCYCGKTREDVRKEQWGDEDFDDGRNELNDDD